MTGAAIESRLGTPELAADVLREIPKQRTMGRGPCSGRDMMRSTPAMSSKVGLVLSGGGARAARRSRGDG